MNDFSISVICQWFSVLLLTIYGPFSHLSYLLSAENEGHNRVIQDDQENITGIANAFLEENLQGLAYSPVSENSTVKNQRNQSNIAKKKTRELLAIEDIEGTSGEQFMPEEKVIWEMVAGAPEV